MSAPAFRLRARPFCPVADSVGLALARRGTDLALECVPTDMRVRPVLTLQRAGSGDVQIADPLAMIELIEDLHPGLPLHPAEPLERAAARDAMAGGLVLQARLDAVTGAGHPVDLDITVHHLQAALAVAERCRAARRRADEPTFDNADVVCAPTLCRLRALDVHAGAYLLAGHPALTDWAERLAAHPHPRSVLDTDLPGWLADLARRGAAIVAPPPDHVIALAGKRRA